MPRPISVKAVGNPIMITTTMSAEHQEPEGGIAHVLQLSAHAALARRFLDVMRARDRRLARLLVDIFAVGELFLDDVDLGRVLEPARPDAGLAGRRRSARSRRCPAASPARRRSG